MFVLFFFPFTEVLSERFSVNASGGGGGGAWWGRGCGFHLLLFGCFCLFLFCGRVLDKKRLTIFPEGDRSYICLMGIFGY